MGVQFFSYHSINFGHRNAGAILSGYYSKRFKYCIVDHVEVQLFLPIKLTSSTGIWVLYFLGIIPEYSKHDLVHRV